MHATTKLFISGLLCTLLTLPALAEFLTLSKPEDAGISSERLKRIGPLIQSHVDAKDFAGAVTLVVRKGKLVHFEARGSTDFESNKPMRTDTLFRMASMTKPITTVAVLMLMEEGKLMLSDPVSKFISDFKDPKVAMWNLPNDPRGAGVRLVTADREVTLQHILTHTAGLAVSTEGPAGEYFRAANLTQGLSLAEFSKRAGTLPLNFQPGTQWQYTSTVGFAVLGRVVEIVSGMNLDQFFKQRIFMPLGMNNTFFNIPNNRISDVAPVYTRTGQNLPAESRATATAWRRVLFGLRRTHGLRRRLPAVLPNVVKRWAMEWNAYPEPEVG